MEQPWQQNGDSAFRMGKVGINTSEPAEALTVHGNIRHLHHSSRLYSLICFLLSKIIK
jgi:hypothetical protein